MFIILRSGSKILYEMLNDNWLVSFRFFFRIYLPIPFRNVNFLDKMFPGDPLLQGFFSLSKRFTNPSLPHRGSAEPRPHIPLPRDKVVLAEAPSAGMFFRPCQGRPRTVLYCPPFVKKKKRGMSVPFYGLADIDHAISETRYNTYICILFYSKWTDCKL